MAQTVTGNKKRFIQELAESGSVKAAAQAVGVATRTGYRWLDDSDVKAALATVTAGFYAELASRASTMAGDALDVLHDIATSETPPARRGVQVRAALGILDVALKLRDAVDVDTRLQAIEERLEQRQGGNTNEH